MRRLDDGGPRTAAIAYNFRMLRRWTQREAAAWYGVSMRTWRRYEQDGAPLPLLNRIAAFAKRGGAAYERWLV